MSIDLTGKRVLITGGLGFLGSNLARKFANSGAKVIILDSMMSLYGANIFNIEDIQQSVTLEIGDARNYLQIERLASDVDYIIHLAAQISYIDSKNMSVQDLSINCESTLNILEACRKNNPKVKIIFSSSRMVYGKIVYTPTDEIHPTIPLSLYGIHKLTCENYFRYFHAEYGIKSIIFRISNPYGPRQQMKHNKYSIVGWFIRMAMENKEISIFGDGSQIRDYIYVDDLVDGILNAMVNEKIEHDVFNLGSGKGIEFAHMINAIIEIVGSGSSRNVPWPSNYEKIETGGYISNQKKLQSVLNWNPCVSLEEGIKRTYDFYRQYQSKYW